MIGGRFANVFFDSECLFRMPPDDSWQAWPPFDPSVEPGAVDGRWQELINMRSSSGGRSLASGLAAILVVSLGVPSSRAASLETSYQNQGATQQPAQTAAVPADYVIGPEDVLSIVFWRDKDMSADVVVRPDGKVSLPLINEIQAAGLTPEQLRGQLEKAAAKYVSEPNVTVVVKEIHSRNVFITGQVTKPGTYPLTAGMTVMQLIAIASGLLEYADAKNVVVMRTEQGASRYYKFNYKDVVRQKNVEQNIALRPGDTVVVP